MVRQFILFLFFSLFISSAWAVKFESSVDRSQIGEGESLILTVRFNNNTLTGNPDFSPLKQQFDIINQQRKSSFQFINGQSESWTIWTLALIPKRLGNLVIPSLNYSGESTKIIQIQVNKISNDIKNKQKDVFFHTEIDVKTAYVQGQILYTEKLYFSVPLDNSQLSEVIVDEAVVQALGETKHYRTQLNGVSFDVYERVYVIHPQVSGEMVIPGPRYTGEINNGRWRAGRPIRITQPPLKVQVLPQPASYPQKTWLPAQTLSLDYDWNGNPQKIKVGEPITLSIKLTARGLGSAQLPVITLPEVKGLKYYPDQALSEDSATEQGIIGVRSHNIAIVPTRSGSLTLPEIRIPWWNTTHGRLEYAVIPPLRLTSQGGKHNNVLPAEPDSSSPPVEVEQVSSAPQETNSSSAVWPIVALILLVFWLVTLYFWWQKKPTKDAAEKELTTEKKNNASLKSIKLACRANDPKMARSALLSWAQAKWKVETTSLMSLSKIVDVESLSLALNELDTCLYSPLANKWQGENLWQLINAYKPHTAKGTNMTPLYPNNVATNETAHG